MGSGAGVRGRTRSAGALAALAALVLAGCTTTPSATPGPTSSSSSAASSPGTATVSVSVGSDGSASASSQGYGVTLDAGAATGGELRLTPGLATDVPGAYDAPLVSPLGPAMDLELSGGELTGSVTVTFPAPDGLSGSSLLVVVWQDGQGGWQVLPATLDGGLVTAQATHLSWGFLATVDVKALSSAAHKAFRQYVGAATDVQNPQCPGQAQVAAEGTQLVEAQSFPALWCVGLENGRRMVKITNNAQIYEQVTYPKSWSVVAGESTTSSVRALAGLLGQQVALPRGTAARVLASGDTITLTVPEGAEGRANLSPSWVTWAASALVFGATEYGSVAEALQSPLATSSLLADPAGLLGITSGTPSDALQPCVDALSKVKPDVSPRTEHDILYASVACVPQVVTSSLQGQQLSGDEAWLPLLAGATTQALEGVASRYPQRRYLGFYVPLTEEELDFYGVFVFPPSLLAGRLSMSGGWAGVTPGQDISRAAASLGLTTRTTCSPGIDGPVQMATPAGYPMVMTDWPQDSSGGTTVASITVYDNGGTTGTGIVGPDDLHVGDPVSQHPSLTTSSQLVSHETGQPGASYSQWVLKTGHGWYFWMQATSDTGKVTSFGLSSTKALAGGVATHGC